MGSVVDQLELNLGYCPSYKGHLFDLTRFATHCLMLKPWNLGTELTPTAGGVPKMLCGNVGYCMPMPGQGLP